MAQLYFRAGLHERPAEFEFFFRSNPDYGEHRAGYCVNAGARQGCPLPCLPRQVDINSSASVERSARPQN